MVEGKQRARIKELSKRDGAFFSEMETYAIKYPVNEELQAVMSKILSRFEHYAKVSHHLAFEGLMPTLKIDDPDRLADVLAAHMMISTGDKQVLLDTLNPSERLERLSHSIEVEIEKVNLDKRINVQVKKQLERAQKQIYLNEKIKVMEEVLAQGDWAGQEEQKKHLQDRIEAIKSDLYQEGPATDREPESELPEIEERVEKQVKRQMQEAEKEYYLNEKMRAIREELGLDADPSDAVKEPENGQEPSLLRSIEFPPEYHEAGVSILSYFAAVLRDKYDGTEVAVTITQEGHRVTMAIETPEGKREEVERTLNDFSLVVRGKMDVTEFSDDPIQILDLRNELRIMHTRLEAKKELMEAKNQLIRNQEVTIEGMGQLLSQALERQPAAALPPIHIHNNNPLHLAVDAKGGDATVQQALCLQEQLPGLRNHLREAARFLPAEQGRKLFAAGAALDQLDENADKGQVRAALGKIAQTLEDAGDEKSKLSKAVKGAKKAGKALQSAGRAYNSIAQWCGAPVVPDVLLGRDE